MTEFGNILKRAMATAAAATVLWSCQRVPDHVIKPDDMAPLLADLSVAESVVEMNYSNYSSDSARKALKQAVLERYGVDQAKLDTSFVWYGGHLDMFMDICDDADKLLQERVDKSEAVAAAIAATSVSGDSVDVWGQRRQFGIDSKSAGSVLTFNIKSDGNTRPGDSYTWRAKIFNMGDGRGRWGMVAEYTDGTLETLDMDLGGEDWHQLSFYTDSTRTMSRMYGYMRLPARATVQYLDSVELVRKRVNRQEYMQRYRQRAYTNVK
ncbi:MAG: DUF4296 domain-containing protein [Muribaculaceae bacterium]|nr:DUF4296 domain-containing protein [Muribaculaceae bacterium]